jgi:hypothetical protein
MSALVIQARNCRTAWRLNTCPFGELQAHLRHGTSFLRNPGSGLVVGVAVKGRVGLSASMHTDTGLRHWTRSGS